MSNKGKGKAMKPAAQRALVPKLRFPEFRDAGEWKKKTLDDIAFFFKGKGISKSDIDLQGETPCIRYGELYTIYSEVIRTVFSKTKLLSSELFFSQKKDVLIPSSGETKLDIAKASCLLLDNIALGGDLNVLRSSENGIFLSYLLNGVCKSEIAKKAQGDTVVHLYASQLKLLNVMVPEEPEQQKIADCLTSLDELITAEAQKLDALKTHKKGLMQQLFPAEGKTLPKLRFSEFQKTGKWKTQKVSGLLERITNPVSIDLDERYRQIGIRSHGKGIFHKEPVSGEELGNKRVFWVEENAFVVNIVFAWEQAVANTTAAEKGMVASHRFPMYKHEFGQS